MTERDKILYWGLNSERRDARREREAGMEGAASKVASTDDDDNKSLD